MLMLLAMTVCAGFCAPASADTAQEFDFGEVYHFMEVYYSVRFETLPVIRNKWRHYYGDMQIVDIKNTRNRYFLGVPNNKSVYEILIRGTANLRNVVYDLKVRKNYNSRLGINLHRGFEKAALAVYHDLRPRINKEFDIYLYGHSLGAAEAVILGMLLEKDGYRVKKVIASGQPKVTDAQGIEKYTDLPVIRVVHENDVIPLLPPKGIYRKNPYRHFQGEVILLEGEYYCLPDERIPNIVRQGLNGQTLGEILKDHNIRNYLRLIEPKVRKSIRIPYSERNNHIQERGS